MIVFSIHTSKNVWLYLRIDPNFLPKLPTLAVSVVSCATGSPVGFGVGYHPMAATIPDRGFAVPRSAGAPELTAAVSWDLVVEVCGGRSN